MLISCYQCRKQLEVPDDSAGKRVRCPQCQHVIVVPALMRGTGATDAVLALPSLELDDGAAPAMSAPVSIPMNVPPVYPLPPIELPPSEPAVASKPGEMDEMPSIDRKAGRRLPMKPTPGKPRWGRTVGIGLGAGGVLCILIVCVMSMGWESRRKPPRFVAKAPPPVMPPPPMEVPKVEMVPPMENPGVGGQPPPAFQWRDHVDAARRFRCQFPREPIQQQQNVDGIPMTVFSVQQGEWEFMVAHGIAQGNLPGEPTNLFQVSQRFVNIERSLNQQNNGFREIEQILPSGPASHAREWWFRHNNQQRWFVRAHLVYEGDRRHQYLVGAKGPVNGFNFTGRNHPDVMRFFGSFSILPSIEVGLPGQALVTEIDDLNANGRRENEFTTFVQHPHKSFVALGTSTGAIKVYSTRNERAPTSFVPNAGKAVERLQVSRDGRWLASVSGGEIQVWQKWEGLAQRSSAVPGQACAFTKEDRLLIVAGHEIKDYDPQTQMFGPMTEVPDLALHGLTLSPDGNLLAVFGAKEILLWDWPARKLLGNIEAHDDRITAVAFAPDGKTLASASADRTIKLWDVESRTERATLRQHAWTVADLAFASDGSQLASAGVDGMLLLWDLQPKQPELIGAQPHRFPVRSLEWDAQGKHLLFTCKQLPTVDGRRFVRQLRKVASPDMKANAKAAQKTVAGQAGLHLPASASQLALVGDTLLTSSTTIENNPDARRARLWDVVTGRLRHEFPIGTDATPTPDGKWLLLSMPAANGRRQLAFMDPVRQKMNPKRVALDSVALAQVHFTPDATSFWLQQKHEYVRYEVPTLQVLQRLKLKEPNDARSVFVTPALDGLHFLVSSSTPGGLRKRTLFTSAEGKEVPVPEAAEPSAFLRLRKNVNFIELSDTLHGSSQAIGQQRHPMGMWAIHPGRKMAATDEPAADRPVRIHLWDLVERQPKLTLPEPAARSLSSIRFSPEGGLLVYTTSQGWTRVAPIDWLLERREHLKCDGEVGPP